jgi:hypothetical protein
MRRHLLLALLLGLSAQASHGQDRIEPAFSIWDVTLGEPVSQVPEATAGEIACGTAGGPVGLALVNFEDFMDCPPEPSGLREVQFSYDDEQDYVARALEVEFKFLQGGTSVYAHPVILSLLVDEAGLVQGRRILTDNRAADTVRRTAYTLGSNFKAQYDQWSLDCAEIPMADGEMPVGSQFVHELCTGQSPDGGVRIAFESTYLRKKGQEALNRETQQVNTGYFESQTRYEEVLAPYEPAPAP